MVQNWLMSGLLVPAREPSGVSRRRLSAESAPMKEIALMQTPPDQLLLPMRTGYMAVKHDRMNPGACGLRDAIHAHDHFLLSFETWPRDSLSFHA
jgi:hypothetical protein